MRIKRLRLLLAIGLGVAFLLPSCRVFGPLVNWGKPEVLDFYFERKDGTRIADGGGASREEGYVYMVVETKNLIGKTFTLTLEDEDGIYIYRGKRLPDTLQLTVKRNRMRYKLYLFDEDNPEHRWIVYGKE